MGTGGGPLSLNPPAREFWTPKKGNSGREFWTPKKWANGQWAWDYMRASQIPTGECEKSEIGFEGSGMLGVQNLLIDILSLEFQ